ncbi:MAG TPA: bifunctional 4-hydroxy-3-methylbut-2-enyl diphosphate reductase/30S ribosomal protein S1 [Thermoanaerobacterales bacterium]|nr:bifunctional 4-hydroxy-3-methylbut-2-enyl diphosphate reductase/30S ribosomal protein S1 [Thermoanaerobacterales bacterium]
MDFVLSKYAGFCFGVKRAVNLAEEAICLKKPVYTLGPLIHNPEFIDNLKQNGVKEVNHISEIDEENAVVVFRTHGVKLGTYLEANKKGFDIIDATCPYVRRAQLKAEQLSKEDYKVIIFGDPSHPEVEGINSYCENKAEIVQSLDELKEANLIDINNKIGIIAQTTANNDEWNKIVKYLKENKPTVKIFNTICDATSQRQKAAKELASAVDLMIVVGGYNSSNTRKLTEISKSICEETYQIENAKELNIEWFKNKKKIGITAGASTPDWIIKEVISQMKEISETEIRDTEASQEEDILHQNKLENKENKDEDLQEKYEETFKTLKIGDITSGTVVQVSENEVMVNVGYKSDGIIPLNELSSEDFSSPNEIVNKGDNIDVYVLKVEDKDGNLILSKKRADIKNAWDEIEKMYEAQEVIEAKVIEEVKGGLLVYIKGLRGFIPASHVDLQYVPELSVFIGENFKLKIIEVDRRKNRIILSRKLLLEEEYQKKRDKTWENIEEGQIIKGKVQRLTDFGAFVDIGGVDGLVHISELSWGRINHPSEVVKEGDDIEVKVLNVDRERERISLGVKQILPNPWENIKERYEIGSIITGKVIKLVSFGAFVEIEPGIEGLVHISQISWEHVIKPEDVLSVGQEIKVKIMDLNPEEHRMSLSIKEAEGAKNNTDTSITNQKNGVTIGEMFKDILEETKRNIDDN